MGLVTKTGHSAYNMIIAFIKSEPYGVRSALQKEIDGSVYILVAVMQGYHALILGFPRDFNQLTKTQADSLRLKYHLTGRDREKGSHPDLSGYNFIVPYFKKGVHIY